MAETKPKTEEKQEIEKPAQEIQQEIGELTEHIQRLQAEFENYRKRTDEEKKESKVMFNAELLRKIVPIIDHFETALQHPCADKNYEQGMKMIHWLFFDMLEKEGVKMLNPIGETFDSKFHEAVETSNEEKTEDNKITKVMQRGYVYKEYLLQRARVIVNKRQNETK